MSGSGPVTPDELAATRITDWMNGREALGHKADIIGMIRRPDADPLTLRGTDVRALLADATRAHEAAEILAGALSTVNELLKTAEAEIERLRARLG